MSFTLTPDDRRILLADARERIAAELEGRSPRYGQALGASPTLQEPCGAFVTLHKASGAHSGASRSLRGCIGRMAASLPLVETVRMMAHEAAFGDPRFPPLRAEEFPHCDIEISALSPMTRCPDPRQVEVGVHGLYLVRNGRGGVLLPQVPVEQGWNRDEYLDYICVKAGLPAESYNALDAALYTFTAVVFGEK